MEISYVQATAGLFEGTGSHEQDARRANIVFFSRTKVSMPIGFVEWDCVVIVKVSLPFIIVWILFASLLGSFISFWSFEDI